MSVLSVRLLNAVRREAGGSLEKLAEFSDEWLLKTPGFGRKCLSELRALFPESDKRPLDVRLAEALGEVSRLRAELVELKAKEFDKV